MNKIRYFALISTIAVIASSALVTSQGGDLGS